MVTHDSFAASHRDRVISMYMCGAQSTGDCAAFQDELSDAIKTRAGNWNRMQTFHEVYAALRRKTGHSIVCSTKPPFLFGSADSAHATMMRSPTILHVLPEGGDSRKQVDHDFLCLPV